MKFIELHILQSYPVSCLNRDDVGSPKSAIFGGVTRSRISSQCLKRASRLAARQLNATHFAGNRTRKAAADLVEELTQRGWKPEEAREAALKTFHAFASGKAMAKGENDENSGTETTALLYLSPGQVRAVAQCLHEAKQNGITGTGLSSLVAKAVKGTMNDAADIAVFGRMAANEPTLTLEGAGMFAHALSTHRAENEIDFWTAVDDYQAGSGETGAANMGSADFVSATYYRYAALNLGLLRDRDHLAALSPEEFRSIVETFLEATLLAQPSARQNSMNAFTEVGYALGLYREHGYPLQLVNAFEQPVTAQNGLLAPSVRKMLLHHKRLQDFLGTSPDVQVATGTYQPRPETGAGAELAEALIPETVNLKQFITRLTSHV